MRERINKDKRAGEAVVSRRDLLKKGALLATAAALPEVSCGSKGVPARQLDRKVIVLGYDAVDPRLVRKFMEEGHLPNLKVLAEEGTFSELTSSIPPESPVAWSTFSVSGQAGVHGIYDFLSRDVATYTPRISAAEPEYPKFLWDLIPLGKPHARCLRTGKPFWVQAAENGIRSAVLEAPVSFPATRLEADSLLLTGLTTPDLRGTQATYHFFTTDIYSEQLGDTEFGGKVTPIEFGPDRKAEARIAGPWNPITRQKRKRLLDERNRLTDQKAPRSEIALIDAELDRLEQESLLTLPVRFSLPAGGGKIMVELGGTSLTLAQGQWSDWVDVEFSLDYLIRLRGMTRFLPTEIGSEVKIYMAPIEIHPEEPVLPISWPEDFAAKLYRRIGPYKTRGWAAETAALKERKIDERAFMEDLDRIIDAREAMGREVLDNHRPNLFFELFSCPDRVQHMFWRLVDKEHPMYDADLEKDFGEAILHVYQRMDRFVGEVRGKYVDRDTLFVVCSDHGFSSFRKGVNLNTWLVKNGYMKLKGQDDPRYNLRDLFGGGDFFTNVDWSGTRAYALGLGLIFINLVGREAKGTVQPGAEYDQLCREIAGRLKELHDPEDGAEVVKEVYLGREVYSGQRLGEAPDLVLGFASNYRVSWQTALGGVPPELIEHNLEKWSGDHCSIDRRLVPGVLFANRRITLDDPELRDMAPTFLRFLGCPVPDEYEGRNLLPA